MSFNTFLPTWSKGEGKTYSFINMHGDQWGAPISQGLTSEDFDRPYVLERLQHARTEAEKWVDPACIVQKYDEVPQRLRTLPAHFYTPESLMTGLRPFSDGSIVVQRAGWSAVYRGLDDYRAGRAVWRWQPRRG